MILDFHKVSISFQFLQISSLQKANVHVPSLFNCMIQKLTKKFTEDTQKYKILQDIIQTEIDAGTTKAKNSATDALLWLKRFALNAAQFHY